MEYLVEWVRILGREILILLTFGNLFKNISSDQSWWFVAIYSSIDIDLVVGITLTGWIDQLQTSQ